MISTSANFPVSRAEGIENYTTFSVHPKSPWEGALVQVRPPSRIRGPQGGSGAEASSREVLDQLAEVKEGVSMVRQKVCVSLRGIQSANPPRKITRHY